MEADTKITEEETAFLTAIEDNPYDEFVRLVYADWLQDRGRDEDGAHQRLIAPGRVVLAGLGKTPHSGSMLGGEVYAHGRCWEWWSPRASGSGSSDADVLPIDWMTAIVGGAVYIMRSNFGEDYVASKDFGSREAAVDAAAIAYTKLPKSRRTQLKNMGIKKRKVST